MNQRDLANARVLELTLDEERILSARIMASEARGLMRRASLEGLIIEGNREARRRLILCLILAFFLCQA